MALGGGLAGGGASDAGTVSFLLVSSPMGAVDGIVSVAISRVAIFSGRPLAGVGSMVSPRTVDGTVGVSIAIGGFAEPEDGVG